MLDISEEQQIDGHIIAALDKKSLDGISTSLRNLRRSRFLEERYFELFLKDKSGKMSDKPVISGLYFAGRGKWIKPWGDIVYASTINFTKQKSKSRPLDLSKKGLDILLFRMISQLIPAGGHLSVQYERDETEECLRSGLHAVLSPLGYLLWASGFRWFKNWYFPEGWREGGTKLQGNKPIDVEHKHIREEEIKSELERFLKEKSGEVVSQTEKRAIDRAQRILKEIEKIENEEFE